MTEGETGRLARSGAVAGLCPTTEGNLGDGFFNAPEYLAAGGVFGIGSDSHISVSPVEELRWLEYGQRLLHRRRNVLRRAARPIGRRRALRRRRSPAARSRSAARSASLRPATAPIWSSSTPRSPALVIGKTATCCSTAVVFAGNENPVRDVMVGGRWVVEEGHHRAEHAVLARYRTVLRELMG